MKQNVGKLDRIVRTAVGICIVIFGLTLQTWFGLIGVGIIVPAIMGSEPLYTALGLNTRNK